MSCLKKQNASLSFSAEIEGTFYSDPVMGVGWGEQVVTGGSNANCSYAAKYVLNKLWDYGEIKLNVSAKYQIGVSSLGYLYINNNFTNPSTEIGAFLDAWGNEAWGTNLVSANGTVVRNQIADYTDLINYPFTITSTGSNELQLCMGGESTAAYNKRYINSLWIK